MAKNKKISTTFSCLNLSLRHWSIPLGENPKYVFKMCYSLLFMTVCSSHAFLSTSLTVPFQPLF